MDFNPPSAKDLISPGSLRTKPSYLPVMPCAFQSAGPSEIPEPAGVMGYPRTEPPPSSWISSNFFICYKGLDGKEGHPFQCRFRAQLSACSLSPPCVMLLLTSGFQRSASCASLCRGHLQQILQANGILQLLPCSWPHHPLTRGTWWPHNSVTSRAGAVSKVCPHSPVPGSPKTRDLPMGYKGQPAPLSDASCAQKGWQRSQPGLQPLCIPFPASCQAACPLSPASIYCRTPQTQGL